MKSKPMTNFSFANTEITVGIHYCSSPGVRDDMIDSIVLVDFNGDKDLAQGMFQLLIARYGEGKASQWPRERDS